MWFNKKLAEYERKICALIGIQSLEQTKYSAFSEKIKINQKEDDLNWKKMENLHIKNFLDSLLKSQFLTEI